MRKNKMMRLASSLLVAVLITTSTISGTFAKYTTQDSANDSARVAKWGIELQVVGNLYGDSYGADNKIVKNADGSVTVQAINSTDDLVAPGTKNDDGFIFSLKGQPEVDGVVTTVMKYQNVFLKENTYGVMIPVDAGVVNADNFDEFVDESDNKILYEPIALGDGNFKYSLANDFTEDTTYYTLEDVVILNDDYYPVVYALDGNTATSDDEEKITVNSLEKAAIRIANQLGIAENTTEYSADNDQAITVYTGTKEFASNYNLTGWNVDGLTLTWAWAFGDPNKVGNSADETDMADTILGLLNNDSTDNTPEGFVVMSDGENSYIAPVEYDDYCVDTQFSIDITVTQVD